MLNFNPFQGAGSLLASIELIQMIRRRQFAIDDGDAMSLEHKFTTLGGMARPV